MVDILSTGLSGLNASRMRALAAANNLSNINTPGFRAQRPNTASAPSSGTRVNSVSTRTNQGALRPTGNPTDLAVVGNGFFQVSDGQGNTSFTRDGSFSQGPNGNLINSQGFSLQPAVNIPQDATSINVGEDGTLSARFSDGRTEEIGQIQLANFSNPEGLSREGGNLLRQTDASGVAQIGAPGENGTGFIQSGFLESSNVDIAQEAINLNQEVNATQANAAVIKTGDEMTKSVIDILA